MEFDVIGKCRSVLETQAKLNSWQGILDRSLLCSFNIVLGIVSIVFNSLCRFQRSVLILLTVSATAALLFQL